MPDITWLRGAFDHSTFHILEWTIRVAAQGESQVLADEAARVKRSREARDVLRIVFQAKSPPPSRNHQTILEWIDSTTKAGFTPVLQPLLAFVRSVVDDCSSEAEKIAGQSAAILDAILRTILAAKSTSPQKRLLLEGATGVGKELFARLFGASLLTVTNLDSDFRIINCGGVPETLFESELFGVAKGTATGVEARPGLLDGAKGIFLDEVEALPLSCQAKLLRFLNDGRYTPLGGRIQKLSDAAIVSATNESLETMVDRHRFREDLYFRLCGRKVLIPPLRTRPEDIVPIARQFADRKRCFLADDALHVLTRYKWPGNVRDLLSVLEAAFEDTIDRTIRVSNILISPEIQASVMSFGDAYAIALACDVRLHSDDDDRRRLLRTLPLQVAAWLPGASIALDLLLRQFVRYRVVYKQTEKPKKKGDESWFVGEAVSLIATLLGADDKTLALERVLGISSATTEFGIKGSAARDWLLARIALATRKLRLSSWDGPDEGSLMRIVSESIESVRAEVEEVLQLPEICKPSPEESSKAARVRLTVAESVRYLQVLDGLLEKLAGIVVSCRDFASLVDQLKRQYAGVVVSLLRPQPSGSSQNIVEVSKASDISKVKGALHTGSGKVWFNEQYHRLRGSEKLTDSEIRTELAKLSGKSRRTIGTAMQKLNYVVPRPSRKKSGSGGIAS